MYEVSTSCPLPTSVWKSRSTLGRAMLTMVESRIDMNEPMVVTASGNHRGSRQDGLRSAGACARPAAAVVVTRDSSELVGRRVTPRSASERAGAHLGHPWITVLVP